MNSFACDVCRHKLEPEQRVCVCGYSKSASRYVRPTTNELAFRDRRFGSKRWEALVIGALFALLRDCEIRFQYCVEVKGRRRLLDAYLPAIKLAIEVDEPHHRFQSDADEARREEVEQAIGCSFHRIDCTKPVLHQVDDIVKQIRKKLASQQLPPWHHPAPETPRQTGLYVADMVSRLERSGATAGVRDFAVQVAQLGWEVDPVRRFNGLPDPGNGGAGFCASYDGINVIVTMRSRMAGFRLLIAGWPDDATSGPRLRERAAGQASQALP